MVKIPNIQVIVIVKRILMGLPQTVGHDEDNVRSLERPMRRMVRRLVCRLVCRLGCWRLRHGVCGADQQHQRGHEEQHDVTYASKS